MNDQQQQLMRIYKAALESVQGDRCVFNSLKQAELKSPVAIIAIGKAATSMMKGAMRALGDQYKAGLLITKTGYGKDLVASSVESELSGLLEKVECLEAGHPVPDEHSLIAGQRLLSFIEQYAHSHTMVFLISGGTSSLVEVLPEGVSLDDLQRVNEWLLGSGLDIVDMNCVRSSLSCVKAGRLAKRLGNAQVLNLLISDVPDNDPRVIGSGLLVPTFVQRNSPPDVPLWIQQLLGKSEGLPLESDGYFSNIETRIIATIDEAKKAAAIAGREMGYSVVVHEEFTNGDAKATGEKLAHKLIESEPALHIWGGETTVNLPETSGRGGRNQHLALAAASVLSEHKNCWLLAAGTDGSDGPTNDAGAIVDGETLERALSAGFTPDHSLSSADAGSFLAASGDLLQTGPTGTNVMDLVIGLKL